MNKDLFKLTSGERRKISKQLSSQENGYFSTIPSYFIDKKINEKRIYPGYLITFMAIYDNAFFGNNTGVAKISAKKIAELTGENVNNVYNHINWLKENKFIMQLKRGISRLFLPLFVADKDYETYLKNAKVKELLVNSKIKLKKISIFISDAKAIIPTKVLRSNLNPVHKLAYGMFVSRSLNNPGGSWQYDSVADMAEYLGVSIATAYRYLKVLTSTKVYGFYLHKENAKQQYTPKDTFTIEHAKIMLKKREKNPYNIDNLEIKSDSPLASTSKVNPKLEAAIKELFRY